ncbi:hypothetical protein GPALN_012322 [Globodera pallida]|nr:hypothetical protein GPALN_012322 [Globodera pallida]
MAYNNNNNNEILPDVEHDGLGHIVLPDYSEDEWRQHDQQRQQWQQREAERQRQVQLERQQQIRQRPLWPESWREEAQKRKEDAQSRENDFPRWARKKAEAEAEAEKNWAKQKDELKKQEADWKQEEAKNPDRFWYRSGCGGDFSGGN